VSYLKIWNFLCIFIYFLTHQSPQTYPSLILDNNVVNQLKFDCISTDYYKLWSKQFKKELHQSISITMTFSNIQPTNISHLMPKKSAWAYQQANIKPQKADKLFQHSTKIETLLSINFEDTKKRLKLKAFSVTNKRKFFSRWFQWYGKK